jgi:hypothetical protein
VSSLSEVQIIPSENYSQSDVEKRIAYFTKAKQANVRWLQKTRPFAGYQSFLVKGIKSDVDGSMEKQNAIVLYDNNRAILFFYFKVIKGKRIQERRVGVSQKYQGQGLASKFYVDLITNGHEIYSDDYQTPAGAALWQKLYRQYNKRFSFLHYNMWDSQFYHVVLRGNKFISAFHKLNVYDAGPEHLMFVSRKSNLSKTKPKKFQEESSVDESIVDIPRKTYAKDIFDGAETSDPKLKPEVISFIKKGLKEFLDIAPIIDYELIGSILTHRYKEDTDLDVNTFFSVQEDDAEYVHSLLNKRTREVSGKVIPGTKHPVNYYMIVSENQFKMAAELADAVFDIRHNEFIRKSSEESFNAQEYMQGFEKKVKQIDLLKGELHRDIIDYKELESLSDEDVKNLHQELQLKLSKIEADINKLVDIYLDTREKRKAAFSQPLTPQEIQQYGHKNRLPSNVIYKMLEKYYYLHFLQTLQHIIGDDRKLSKDELAKLMKH